MNTKELLAEVNDYYTTKVREHGATPRGVDWNSEQSQETRFSQLLRVVDWSSRPTVGDYGCGYGALLDYLKRCALECDYRGYDISAAMIAEARRRSLARDAEFGIDEAILTGCDYVVASGIFNVRSAERAMVWRDYVAETVDRLASIARRGFAFNCLTSYSDAERMRADLHYADPCELFDYCKRRFSRNVALLHDYELYEFTILVRK